MAVYQLRGGTTQDQENFVGYPREITVDIDKKQVRVHDGQTPGGTLLAKETSINGTFVSTDNKRITIANGVITQIVAL